MISRRATLRGVAVLVALTSLGAMGRNTSRLVTVEDVLTLRKAESLSLSPRGDQYAVFVRQADPAGNDYRTSWYVGDVTGESFMRVGDGGRVGLRVSSNGYEGGDIESRQSRWSPDARWIAYPLKRNEEVQLWRSRVADGLQQQITHNAADVKEFEWSTDGYTLFFTVGPARVGLRERAAMKERRGYRYNEDLDSFADFMKPDMPQAPPSDRVVWVVNLEDGREHRAEGREIAEFGRLSLRGTAGTEYANNFLVDAAVPPISNRAGAQAWLERSGRFSRKLRLMVRLPHQQANTICSAESCTGPINKLWWSADGRRVIFWRNEGINDRGNGVYAWMPGSRGLRTVVQLPDDYLTHCELAGGDQLICIRETKTRPAHIAAIDAGTGKVRIIADLNPQFRNIRLGRVERFEWETPRFQWNEAGGRLAGLYPARAYGYILYPPDFDSTKKYPAFLDPYAVVGFEPSAGFEHSLHVYAASGFVVINTGFPMPVAEAELLGAKALKEEYSQELGFPHLTFLAASTLRGLDLAISRGFIDSRRVGTGGVSHGSFIPLYLIQQHPDRIAALSISSPNWGMLQYYFATRRGQGGLAASRGKVGAEDWQPSPEGPGREFWQAIDIADHVEAIRAPILMNLAAFETFGLLRLIRHMDDAGRAYDAYVFRDETHLKWQPAHRCAILNRNLDWFRFWLQDYEDPDTRKRWQYSHWRGLRELQCRNDGSRWPCT